MLRKLFIALMLTLLAACTGVPEGIEAVKSFQSDRYLGKWYEIARLDHGFERGLSQVTAEYLPREQGGIKVINRGYSAEDGEWQQVEGKAFAVNDDNSGHLKVSFFGPFYASYVIFNLDDNYQYAFITGPSRDYLWLLAREPHVSDKLKQKFIEQADQQGFAVDELIFVDHD